MQNQQFDNGDEVEVREDAGFEWKKARYISYDEKFHHHIVDNGSKYTGYLIANIRPDHLICDEARRFILETYTKFKIRVATFKHLKELESFIRPDINYRLLDADKATERDINTFNDVKLPELDLRTGEVTECEQYWQGAYIADLESEVKDRDKLLKSSARDESATRDKESSETIKYLQHKLAVISHVVNTHGEDNIDFKVFNSSYSEIKITRN